MNQQTDGLAATTEDGSDSFASTLNLIELELLQTLYRPALVPERTAELAHLRNLGLVFVDPQTGYAQVTPLGRSWLWSQTNPASYG